MSVLGVRKNRLSGSMNMDSAPSPPRKMQKEKSFLTARSLMENMEDPRKAKLQIWKDQKNRRKAQALKERNFAKPVFVVPTRQGPISEITQTQTQSLALRKDLRSIFADEGKTSFLTDLLSQMSVETTDTTNDAAKQKAEAEAATVAPTVMTTSPSISRAISIDEQQIEQMKKDGEHFRGLAQAEKATIEELSKHWSEFVSKTHDLSDEWRGEISATIGQSNLLCNKKFKQFFGLCDLNQAAEAAADGLTARNADLDGFWEIIVMQIDDVKRMFKNLEEKKADGWVDKEEVMRAPKKKKRGRQMKAKQPLARVMNSNKPGPVTPRRAAAKGRLAAFRAQMKKRGLNQGMIPAQQVTREILTPVRATRKEQHELGSSMYITSVRRSARKTPSKYRARQEDNVADMLASANFSYKPNPALQSLATTLTPELEEPCGSPTRLSTTPEDFGEESVSVHLFAATPEPQKTPLNRGTRQRRRSSSLPPSATNSPWVPQRVPKTPSRVDLDLGFEKLECGSIKKFAPITPSASMREYLGTDLAFTPVRRSRRIAQITTDENCIESASDMPENSGYIPNPSVSMF